MYYMSKVLILQTCLFYAETLQLMKSVEISIYAQYDD